jgi:hypothetical protein
MFKLKFLTFIILHFAVFAYAKDVEELDELRLLSDFYPSAARLCGQEFRALSAEKLENVYSAIVKVFNEKRWSYFCDSESGFSGKYLDKIIGELERYIEFLESFKVDFQTGCSSSDRSRLCSLKDFWHHNLGKNTYYRFYAIYLDYLFMKVYSYPMRMILNREDLYQASSTSRKIGSSISKLASSKFENYYQKALERAFRIFKLLEEKVTKNSQNDLCLDYE